MISKKCGPETGENLIADHNCQSKTKNTAADYFSSYSFIFFIAGALALGIQIYTFFAPMLKFQNHIYNWYNAWQPFTMGIASIKENIKTIRTVFIVMYIVAGVFYLISAQVKKPLYALSIVPSLASLTFMAFTYLAIYLRSGLGITLHAVSFNGILFILSAAATTIICIMQLNSIQYHNE